MREEIIAGLGQMLRDVNPEDPAQVAEADALAGAAMTVAMAFVQDRRGKDAAALFVNSMFEQAAALMSGTDKSEPAGSSVPALHPATRGEPASSIQAMAETMLGYLHGRASAAADAEARASIWAATAFLQQREGERAALDYLSFIRSTVGTLGNFERLSPASLARH